MQNRNYTSGHVRTAAIATSSEIRWKYMLVALLCGLVVAAGFFFAAKQHFASMDYSMQNNTLRKQVESLKAEKRRLLLAREVSLSPGEIRKAHHRILASRKSSNAPTQPAAQKASLKTAPAAIDTAQVAAADSAPKAVKAKAANHAVKQLGDKQAKLEAGESDRYRYEMTAIAKMR